MKALNSLVVPEIYNYKPGFYWYVDSVCRYIDILSKHKPKIQWNADTSEHVFTFKYVLLLKIFNSMYYLYVYVLLHK